MIQALTPISNKNVNRIFEHYSTHLDYKIDTTFIKPIYHLIRVSNISISTESNITLKRNRPSCKYSYMAKEIKEYIENHTFYQYSTDYRIDTMGIRVNLYSHNKIDARQYLFFIKLVLSMCSKSATHSPKEIDISIILTPIKKSYPQNPVEPSHVNSGQTDLNKNEIIVFRKEEWFKVFIHECFHLFCLDFCKTTIDFTRTFKKLYHVESEFLLFESYTEFWARIMNLSILSYFTKQNISYAEFEEMIKINLQVERLYSISQMNHLLGKMNYTYEDLIHFKGPILKEKTNFFCYYVLTSIMFFYLNDTMKWFIQHDSFIQFSNKKVYPFMNYLIQLHKKPEFLQLVRQLYKPLYNANMSAFEILF